MGWTAFLLHRFAHGLDSLFTFEVWVDLSAQMEEPCALWLLLLRKFAIGKLSACEVQELAMAANKSGATCGFLVKLGSIGSMGQVPGNCHRDLCRLDSIFFLTGRNNGLDSL